MIARLLESLILLSPDLPPEAVWLPVVTLIILAAAAAIDAAKARIPDNVILTGFAILIVGIGLHAGWPSASLRLTFAIMTAIGFYALNQLWYKLFRRDAFGMGDAKWSALAVMMFGFVPVITAWVAGSILGLIWLGGARMFGKKQGYVHFSPFLFVGLLSGLLLQTTLG